MFGRSVQLPFVNEDTEISMDSSSPKDTHLLAWLRNRILGGLVIVIPTGLTFWFGYFLFTNLSEWAVTYIHDTYPDLILNANGKYIVWALWSVRAGSILLMLFVLVCIGQLGRYTLGRKLISLTDTSMRRLPMLSTVYNTARQIWEAIWNTRSDIGKRVVLFEYPRRGIWVIGFMTNENADPQWEPQQRAGTGLVSVFLPTTPNPTSGFFLLVPRSDCIQLDMEPAEAMRLIISGGAVAEFREQQTEFNYKKRAAKGVLPPEDP